MDVPAAVGGKGVEVGVLEFGDDPGVQVGLLPKGDGLAVIISSVPELLRHVAIGVPAIEGLLSNSPIQSGVSGPGKTFPCESTYRSVKVPGLAGVKIAAIVE